jgi:hypothetical protein
MASAADLLAGTALAPWWPGIGHLPPGFWPPQAAQPAPPMRCRRSGARASSPTDRTALGGPTCQNVTQGVTQGQNRQVGFSAKCLKSLARSERFELPTLGIEIRCSIQLSYERVTVADTRDVPTILSGLCLKQACSETGALRNRDGGGHPGRYRRPSPDSRGWSRGHRNRRRYRASGPGRSCGDS